MSSWQQNPLTNELTISRQQEATMESDKITNKLRALKLKIFPGDVQFEAGGEVNGHLQLKCTNRKLRVKAISIELTAYETVTTESSKQQIHPVMARQVDVVQQPDGPPCEGISTEQARSHEGYWKFTQGIFKYPFTFSLPEDVPTSIILQKSDGIYYKLTASVSFMLGQKAETLVKDRYIKVTAKHLDAVQNTPLETSFQVWGFWKGKGQNEMRCKLLDSIVSAGSLTRCQVSFKNHSRKKVGKVELSLVRRLKTFVQRPDGNFFPARFYRQVENEIRYVAKEYDFGEEPQVFRLLVPELTNPSVTNGKLIEITYALKVKATAGSAKPVIVELPLTVVSSTCMQFMSQKSTEPEDIDETIPESQMAELAPVVAEQIENKRKTLKELKSDSAFQSQANLPENEPEMDFDAHLEALKEVTQDVDHQPENFSMGRVPPPPSQLPPNYLDPRVLSYVNNFRGNANVSGSTEDDKEESIDDATTVKAEIQSDGYHLKNPQSSQDAIDQMQSRTEDDDKELVKSLDSMFADFLK